MTEPRANESGIQTAPASVQSFEQLSALLHSSAGDAESAQLSSSMGELAQSIEAVNASLSQPQDGAAVGPLLVSLLAALRKHRSHVVGLSPSWRGLYEYASYLAALNNFRVLIGQWLLERNVAGEAAVAIEDFEMIGWRTLGEGMLMIDMHQQLRADAAASDPTDLMPVDDSRIAKAKSWWSKVRG
jgi:hypothetical protein